MFWFVGIVFVFANHGILVLPIRSIPSSQFHDFLLSKLEVSKVEICLRIS